ncbi:MAG: carbohydrate-binding protein, partial [Bacteroidales bacterium]|nr:carbohydrate-binding protein [Bacteroidales bacterium]
DWMDYAVNVTQSGTYTVKFRVASKKAKVKFSLKKGKTNLTSVKIKATGGFQKWKTVSRTVHLSAGKQTLRVLANGNGWNINWIEFEKKRAAMASPVSLENIDKTTGIKEMDGNSSKIFKVYPNPASEVLSMEVSVNALVTMSTITGQVVKQVEFAEGNHQVDISNLKDGLYVLSVKTEFGVENQVIIVE